MHCRALIKTKEPYKIPRQHSNQKRKKQCFYKPKLAFIIIDAISIMEPKCQEYVNKNERHLPLVLCLQNQL